MPPNTEAHGERSPARARRGAALLLVLGLIATLGWLAARIVLETRRNLAERAVFVRREQLRATAWSAAECVLAALREKRLVDGELYSLPHDASSLLNATGYVPPRGVRIGTDLRDLSAKTALRSLDADSLRDLFTDLGIPFDNASRLADNYLDAVASPDSRNAADGPLSGAASPKLGRLPDDFHELLTIPGFRENFQNADGSPNDLARDFQECVVFRGDTAEVNLNTASLPALRRLAKRGVIADPVALDRWLAGPDAVRGTDDDRFAALLESTRMRAMRDVQVETREIDGRPFSVVSQPLVDFSGRLVGMTIATEEIPNDRGRLRTELVVAALCGGILAWIVFAVLLRLARVARGRP